MVIDNCNGASDVDTVHDSGLVVTTPAIPLPTGSKVVFSFWTNNTCTGEPVDSEVFDVSGLTNPSIDPALVQGPLTPGGYSYNATFLTGDGTKVLNSVSSCEPFKVFAQPLTPGYWKNHLAFDSKHPEAPYVAENLPLSLGNYSVVDTAAATAVWDAMNCGNAGNNATQNQNALGCLAGHLLATKLNVANGSSPCITATIAAADQFLKDRNYIGPSGNYTGITAEQRATAIALKTLLDTYNNGGGCPAGAVCP